MIDLQRGYNGDWLGGVFSKAVFLGNGLMAILSGLLAHTLVETLNLGPVAPFDAASIVMVLGGAIVLFTWPENYGDSSNKRSFVEQMGSAAKAIAQGEPLSCSSSWIHFIQRFLLFPYRCSKVADVYLILT